MPINGEALKQDIRAALINSKSNACPIIIRLAWHSSGTYSKEDGTGGSNGATMRFDPEAADGANAGLAIARNMLLPVKEKYPDLSFADLWIAAGLAAIEFCGGPAIPMKFGRVDKPNGSCCPVVGRLPDAHLGPEHLREVFYRQGFNDQEIVALSGAHTLGHCHESRSGFDGPWTRHPLKFDNKYFTNLLENEWVPRNWNGEPQFEDKATQELMMLPTDIALIKDPSFKAWVEKYAADEALFFKDFAAVMGKLVSNGCPAECKIDTSGCAAQYKQTAAAPPAAESDMNELFVKMCMHGSLDRAKCYQARGAQVNFTPPATGRAALHGAASWGHLHVAEWLVRDLKANVNVQDNEGDTPLHDAATFGHAGIVDFLVKNGADVTVKNKKGATPMDAAIKRACQKDEVIQMMGAAKL